jgi:hypothetical protein
MVRRGEGEIRDVLEAIGVPAAMSAAAVGLIADTALTGEALDHLAHIAVGFGHQVRRIPHGWAVRRVTMLDRDTINSRLSAWLDGLGVRQIEDGPADAALSILADDGAIFDGLPESQRPDMLVSQAMTSTSIVSMQRPPLPIQRFLDRGVTLIARDENTVLALVSGESDVEARLASALPGPFPMKRLATTRYRRFVTRDGAPLIGRIKGTKQFAIAGLGDCAPFVAPAVARFLAGKAEGAEKAWMLALDPARPRDIVADFVPPMGAAP